MTQSQPAPRPLRALPALVAWLVTLLQVAGALHFALIPHTFSAAMGGVAHVHAQPSAHVNAASPSHDTQRSASFVFSSASCSVDSCPVADAPAGSVLPRAAVATGWVSFGTPCLLEEHNAQLAFSRHLFLSAPKTSPPV